MVADNRRRGPDRACKMPSGSNYRRVGTESSQVHHIIPQELYSDSTIASRCTTVVDKEDEENKISLRSHTTCHPTYTAGVRFMIQNIDNPQSILDLLTAFLRDYDNGNDGKPYHSLDDMIASNRDDWDRVTGGSYLD